MLNHFLGKLKGRHLKREDHVRVLDNVTTKIGDHGDEATKTTATRGKFDANESQAAWGARTTSIHLCWRLLGTYRFGTGIQAERVIAQHVSWAALQPLELGEESDETPCTSPQSGRACPLGRECRAFHPDLRKYHTILAVARSIG